MHAVAAVLTSPFASVWAWHRAAGTGLSAHAVRVGPRWLAELPWPAGDLEPAVAALAAGDVRACGDAVSTAYGLDPGDPAVVRVREWWRCWLPDDGSTAGSAARLGRHESSPGSWP